jgi:hypothetical protein
MGRDTKEDMGDEAVVRREVTLSLEQFGHTALEARAVDFDVPVSALVRQAALYYLAVRGSERTALRIPRFAREAQGEHRMELEVELDEADWSALEVEAVHQRVPIERLLEHAVLLFLADIDSGRVAARILDDDDEDQD